MNTHIINPLTEEHIFHHVAVWRFKIKRIKQSKILPSKWVNEQSNTSYLLCFAYWNDILIPQAFFLIDITQRKFFGKSRHMKCNVHNQMLSKGCSYPIRKVQRFKIKSGIYFFLYRKQTLSTLQQKQCALTTRNAKKSLCTTRGADEKDISGPNDAALSGIADVMLRWCVVVRKRRFHWQVASIFHTLFTALSRPFRICRGKCWRELE